MSIQNTDFLKFNAYSIKDLITRKLTENSKFTDQVYEGSNLAILIDLFSYMAQCMLYSLNSAASESMFSDTQYYENMNRLVKFIGYNPRGCSPARVDFYFKSNGVQKMNKIIPIYSHIDTGMTDSQGKKIYYSTKEEYIIDKQNFVFTMYNGKWKKYITEFTASGYDYETFVLSNLRSDSDAQQYVANDFIHVYVEEPSGVYEKWNFDKDEIFLNTARKNISLDDYATIYSGTEKVYSIRLNENKEYEIKFGNGITGKKLEKGSKLHILYLDTNGKDGEIQYGDIDEVKLKSSFHDNNIGFNYSENDDERKGILNITLNEELYIDDNVYDIGILNNSTQFTPEETVEDIRKSAPQYFKYGNRLITHSDYEYFIKTFCNNEIVDLKCQNNMEYVTSFYKWLYYYGLNGETEHEKSGNYYIKQNKLERSNYKYADPSDANTVYIWMKIVPKINNPSSYIKILQSEVQKVTKNIKTLTQEILLQPAIDVNYTISAMPKDILIGKQKDETYNIKTATDSYLEILIEDNSLYVNSNIQSYIARTIISFFDQSQCGLGKSIDINEMNNAIMSMNGVRRIRTVYIDEKDNNVQIIKNGISFASWSNDFLDKYDDLEVSTSIRSLYDFQYPKLILSETDLMNKIKVIKKSSSNTNNINY